MLHVVDAEKSVVYPECRYAGCRYAECRYVQWSYAAYCICSVECCLP
jgi:hypothetical protein